MSLLSNFIDWWKSIKTIREIDPDNIPDPDFDTVKSMQTKEEEGTKEATIFKIKF